MKQAQLRLSYTQIKRPDSKIILFRGQKIFKGIMVSEKKQSQKVTYCMMPFI